MIRYITAMNLSAIDLNLLYVLWVVLDERSATRAARRLHVTQSAVSNALARLRTLFGDALLTRQGRGLVPTPLAVSLQPVLERALRELASVVSPEPGFDARACTREFSLALADNQALVDLPRIWSAMERRMPLAKLRVVSIDTLLATQGLSTGEVDACFAPTGVQPELRSAPVYIEQAVGLLAKAHPFRRRVLTPEAFATLGQVGFEIAMGRPGAGRKAADRAFRERGLRPDPKLTVSTFAAAAAVVETSKLLACLPRRVASALSKRFAVRVVELPGAPLEMSMSLMWHPRTDTDPASQAFRTLMLDELRPPGAIARAPLVKTWRA